MALQRISKGLMFIVPTHYMKPRSHQRCGMDSSSCTHIHAYSLGSGTYTGLEAVSNNVNRLREPRVVTGKWTMFYMAVSLSMTAAV